MHACATVLVLVAVALSRVQGFCVPRRLVAAPSLARVGIAQRSSVALRRFASPDGGDEAREQREVSREAQMLEGIEGTAPTNFIVPPFLRSIFYGIFAVSALSGVAIAFTSLNQDFGRGVTNIGINAAVLLVITGVAFFDNKMRNDNLQEVQRQLETEYLKKDSPLYFNNEKRAQQAEASAKKEKAAAAPSRPASDDDDDDDTV